MRTPSSISVTFADRQTGWAVGNHGAIWNTRDGGALWERQPSPSEDRLTAARFVSAERGWIVTAGVRPYVNDGVSRLLTTADGGRNWAFVKRAEGLSYHESPGAAWGGRIYAQRPESWSVLDAEGTELFEVARSTAPVVSGK